MNDNNSEVVYLYLDDIIPNRFQPREVFDEQALKELAVSIKEHGVIQPIIVRQVENKYEIIAGERRYKASTMAGLTKIPAIVKNLDDKESSKIALIENLQRKDLSPIEEARTYQKILEIEDNMTQEELAATMGKTQSSVSNKLRLLALPEEVQDALLKDKISERHARTLLNLEDRNDQIKMMDRVIENKMTVRELEKAIKEFKDPTSIEEENQAIDAAPAIVNVDDASLSASDLVNEESQSTERTLADTFMDIKNGIDTETNTEAVSVEEQIDATDPTEVNIDKIRESAVDIGGAKVEEATEVSPEPQMGFKFVPSFSSAGTVTEPPTTPEVVAVEPITEAPAPTEEVSEISPAFEQPSQDLVNKEPTLDEINQPDTIAAEIGNQPIAIAAGGKDISTAIEKIKEEVDSLKNDGYNVMLDEMDNKDNYLISIIFKKDA